MIFGKLTSLVIMWGMMMNIFHPLAHAMTHDVSPSSNIVVSVILPASDSSLDHNQLSPAHHKQDLGKGHCDVCHTSVTAFILGQYSSNLGNIDAELGLFSVVIPTGYQSLGLDQPPQFFA